MKPRKSPCFWGHDTNHPPIQDYISVGAMVMEQAVCQAKLSHVARIANNIADMDKAEHPPGTIYEPDGVTVRSLFDFHRMAQRTDDSIDNIVDYVIPPNIRNTIETILGGAAYLYQSHVNFKKPHVVGSEYAWHSDYTFWHWEDGMKVPRAVSVCIPLVPFTPDNGGLSIMKGSHHTIIHDTWDRKDQPSTTAIRHNYVDDPHSEGMADDVSGRFIETSPFSPPTMDFTGDVGDACIFDANVLHQSGVNHTHTPRMALFMIFNSVHNIPTEPFNGAARRPEYITNGDVSWML